MHDFNSCNGLSSGVKDVVTSYYQAFPLMHPAKQATSVC